MFESSLNKGKSGGYAGLDNTGKLPVINMQPVITGVTYTGNTIFFDKSDSSQLTVENVVNNFSREINICEENLVGEGTMQEKILAYLLSIDYKKATFDGEVMIIVNTCSSGGSSGSGISGEFGVGVGLSLLD